MSQGGKSASCPRRSTSAGSFGWRRRWSYAGVGVTVLSVGLACQTQLALFATVNGTVSFSTQILPILNTNCFRCHREGGQADAAGIDLRLVPEVSYDELVGQPSQLDPTLTHVVPGDPNASLLYLMISSDTPPIGSRMPQNALPLSLDEVKLIHDWIVQGAPRN